MDVVIPVYAGFDETRRCIESVLAHTQETPFELVAIDDCGPEPELRQWLAGQAEAARLTLLVNERNIGFVDSANLGMMLHPERDIVLLNSDTEVNGDWLDRLRRCAASEPDVATATPFSNNATLASYPRYMSDNQLPEGTGARGLDALFARLNDRRYVEIPTAVGFCTYIRRAALEAAGYLDSLHFGTGYGEENDFCMRASAAGLRHLLAGDTFVWHKGGVSFAGEALRRNEAAQETLRQRCPTYEQLVQEHCSRDPERPLRRRVDVARLCASPRGRLLFISHRLGGGTEKHLQELARLIEDDWEVLVLRPAGGEEVSVEWARPREEFKAYFRLPGQYAALVDFLRWLGIERIHVHHFVELPPEALELFSPAALDIPFDMTLHDYYSICPFTNLIDVKGNYCGEPSLAACDLCYATRQPAGEPDARQRRERSARLLAAAQRVFVPSRDALERFSGYFPDARLVLMPHFEAPGDSGAGAESPPAAALQPSGGGEVKVLVLGEMSPAKGLWVLEACARDARERGLPLSFRVLGRPLGRVAQEPELPLSFSGRYADAGLAQLIARERPHLIFFPARWPETWSYTLTAAMRSGLPIAAPRIGSFTERLDDYRQATLLDWDTAPAAWNDLFVLLSQHPAGSSHGS